MSSENPTSICLQTADTGSFTMNYVRFGSGKRNLIIIPGLSVQSILLSANAVESAFKTFEKDFSIYLFDRRNELPPFYTIYEMAEDMASVLKTLGLEHNCIFAASQGGMMTLCLAAKHPNLVEKICLGAASAKVTDFQIFDQWISFAKAGNAKDLYLSFGKAVYTKDVFEKSKAMLESAAKTVTRAELDRFIILASAIRDFDATRLVPQISCPALIIGSSDDKVLGHDASPAIARYMNNPNAKLVMYNGYGHAVYDTAPDFLAQLKNFLD